MPTWSAKGKSMTEISARAQIAAAARGTTQTMWYTGESSTVGNQWVGTMEKLCTTNKVAMETMPAQFVPAVVR